MMLLQIEHKDFFVVIVAKGVENLWSSFECRVINNFDMKYFTGGNISSSHRLLKLRTTDFTIVIALLFYTSRARKP